MTYPISDVLRRVIYSGSAGVGPYSFTFEILEETDINAYLNDTLLALTTNYTVTINVDGTGSITLVTPATVNDKITIVGGKGIDRQTDFVTGGDLFANSLNDELDSQTIFAQQNYELLTRSIKVPVYTEIGFDTTLPSPEAGKHIAWNSNGDGLINDDSPAQTVGAAYTDEVQTATAGQTVFTLTRFTYTPGVRNLSVYINGVRQYAGTSYTETDTTTVTFSSGLNDGDEVLFVTADTVTNDVAQASSVAYTPSGTGVVTTNVQDKLRETVSVKDFGADPSAPAATNDAAFAAAFVAAYKVVVPSSSTYYNISTPIIIPHNGVLDMSGARIVSSDTGVIEFDGDGTLIGNDSYLRTSTSSAGSAIAATSPAPASPAVKILGYPTISIDNTITNSIGVDMTGWYGSYIEVELNNFDVGIYLTSTTGQPCYYNEINKPRIICGSQATAVGIKAEKGVLNCNAATVISPFITGRNTARYGIYLNDVDSFYIAGGYVEGFAPADANSRGIYIEDCNSISIHHIDFDTLSSTGLAIGIYGTCNNINFYGCGFSGAWLASAKILDNPNGNVFSMFGSSKGNQTLINRTDTAFPTTITNGFHTKTITPASGEGLDFTHSAGGSGTVINNLFHTYEEGTWTPASSTITFTSAAGVYTKIGNMVFAYCTVEFPSTADGSGAIITGLPYSVDSVGGVGISFGGFVTYTTATLDILPATSASTILLKDNTSSTYSNAQFSAHTVRLTVIYKAN